MEWLLFDQAKVQVHNIFTQQEQYCINGKIFNNKDLGNIFHHKNYLLFHNGYITEHDMISRFLQGTELDLTIDEYIELFHQGIEPIEGMEEILDKLSNSYQLATLINESSEWARRKLDVSGFKKYFSHIIVSGDIHLAKPDPAFFHYSLEKIDASPEDCLFIDDQKRNCDGAKNIGIKSIVYENTNQLRSELNSQGIILS